MSTKAHDGSLLITFEGDTALASKWSYRVVAKRCPKKGEYYLSGAIPQAYRAPNDLTLTFAIVEPLREYRSRMTWLPV